MRPGSKRHVLARIARIDELRRTHAAAEANRAQSDLAALHDAHGALRERLRREAHLDGPEGAATLAGFIRAIHKQEAVILDAIGAQKRRSDLAQARAVEAHGTVSRSRSLAENAQSAWERDKTARDTRKLDEIATILWTRRAAEQGDGP